MKSRIIGWLLLLMIFLVPACSSTPAVGIPSTPGPEDGPTMTPELAPVVVETTLVPEPDIIVRAYLDAWQVSDYASMYALLTADSQANLSIDDFTERYHKVAIEAALSDVDYDILSSLVRDQNNAQASYRVVLHSVLVGDIQRETVINLSMQSGAWHVIWDDTLILPELAGGNTLWMDRYVPSRANIYDRNGEVIVAPAKAVSVGIVPGHIDPEPKQEYRI